MHLLTVSVMLQLVCAHRGSATVSPGLARATAAAASDCRQVAALITFAWDGEQISKRTRIANANLIEGDSPLHEGSQCTERPSGLKSIMLEMISIRLIPVGNPVRNEVASCSSSSSYAASTTFDVIFTESGSATNLVNYGRQSGRWIRRRGHSRRGERNSYHSCILFSSLWIDPKRCRGRWPTVK